MPIGVRHITATPTFSQINSNPLIKPTRRELLLLMLRPFITFSQKSTNFGGFPSMNIFLESLIYNFILSMTLLITIILQVNAFIIFINLTFYERIFYYYYLWIYDINRVSYSWRNLYFILFVSFSSLILFFFKDFIYLALLGVAQWIECGPANQRVTSWIPSQGTRLGCRPGPQDRVCERQPHIDISPPLFHPPFPSLWK